MNEVLRGIQELVSPRQRLWAERVNGFSAEDLIKEAKRSASLAERFASLARASAIVGSLLMLVAIYERSLLPAFLTAVTVCGVSEHFKYRYEQRVPYLNRRIQTTSGNLGKFEPGSV